MPFCPNCKLEYVDKVKTCVHCQVELVGELPTTIKREIMSDEADELVTIAAFGDISEARSIRDLLIKNDVLCLLSKGNDATGEMEITLHVREIDLFRANSLLIPEMEKMDGSDQADSPTEDNVDTSLPDNTIRCPQCGNADIKPIPSLFLGGTKFQCQNCGYKWKREN